MRRKRELNAPTDMLLVQSIQITDKFGFDEQQSRKSSIGGYSENNETEFTTANPGRGFCVNAFGRYYLLKECNINKENYKYL